MTERTNATISGATRGSNVASGPERPVQPIDQTIIRANIEQSLSALFQQIYPTSSATVLINSDPQAQLFDCTWSMGLLEQQMFNVQQDQAPVLRKLGASEAQIWQLIQIPRLAKQMQRVADKTARFLRSIDPREKPSYYNDIVQFASEVDQVAQKVHAIAEQVKSSAEAPKIQADVVSLTDQEKDCLNVTVQKTNELMLEVDWVVEEMRSVAWNNDLWASVDPYDHASELEQLAEMFPRSATVEDVSTYGMGNAFAKEIIRRVEHKLRHAWNPLAEQAGCYDPSFNIPEMIFMKDGSKGLDMLIDGVVEQCVRDMLFVMNRLPDHLRAPFQKSGCTELLSYISEIDAVGLDIDAVDSEIDTVDSEISTVDETRRNLEELINSAFVRLS
jgi:hypothetical protein